MRTVHTSGRQRRSTVTKKISVLLPDDVCIKKVKIVKNAKFDITKMELQANDDVDDRKNEESEADTRSCNAGTDVADFVRMRYVDDVLYKIVNDEGHVFLREQQLDSRIETITEQVVGIDMSIILSIVHLFDELKTVSYVTANMVSPPEEPETQMTSACCDADMTASQPKFQLWKVFQDKSARVGFMRVCHHRTIHEVSTCTNEHNLREDMRRLEDNVTERGLARSKTYQKKETAGTAASGTGSKMNKIVMGTRRHKNDESERTEVDSEVVRTMKDGVARRNVHVEYQGTIETMSTEELWKKMEDKSRYFVHGGRALNREGACRLNEGSIVRMMDRMKGGGVGRKRGKKQEGMATAGTSSS